MEKMYAKDYRRIAREKLAGHWGTSVLTAFVAALLGGISVSNSSTGITSNIDLDELFENFDTNSTSFSINDILDYYNVPTALLVFIGIITAVAAVWSIATSILGGPTRTGYCQYNINLLKGEGKFDDLFSHYDIFLKAFLAKLLMGIFLVLWTLLLIIPGIIKSYAYSMTFYILAENPGIDPVEAIKASDRMMKGHKWELFCLQISYIGWIILSAFTLGIGALFLTPYMEAGTAAFYNNIKGEIKSNSVDVE